MRRPTGDQEVAGSTLNTRRGRQHSFVEIDHEILSTVILSLPLIQEGQLSVSGERMCTILVNRLDDYACPVNVWLGKLTALDMTPFGWLGRKTSTPKKNRLKLTFTVFLVKFSRRQLDFFLYFSENRILETICMKWQILFPVKNKKNISKYCTQIAMREYILHS